MRYYLIGLVVLASLYMGQVWFLSGQPATLGCDTARDLLGWEQCQTLEHRLFWVHFRGCSKSDAHAYLVQGAGKQALVCCGALFKSCTARSAHP